MSATASVPPVGETVPVPDGKATIVGMDESTVTYDHSEWSTYTISTESFIAYMERDG